MKQAIRNLVLIAALRSLVKTKLSPVVRQKVEDLLYELLET